MDGVARGAGFGGSIDAAAILDFVDSGHDLIVAADSNASDLIREIATECGVDFDEVLTIYLILLTELFFVHVFLLVRLRIDISQLCVYTMVL